MILITRNMRKLYPKAFAAAGKSKFRIVWLRDNLIYCARKARGKHGDYLIRLFATESINREIQVKAQCNTITGGECDGMKWSKEGCCAHIAAFVLRAQSKPNKKQEWRAA